LALLLSATCVVPAAADPPGQVSSLTRDDRERLTLLYTGCGGAIAPASDATYEQAVIDRVNAERAARGLPPLKLSEALRSAARYHATDMAQDDYYDHDTHDRLGGQLLRVCDVWSRVRSYYPSPLSENIAVGYATPASVMAAWLESGGHRDSILNASYREIGVGYARGGSWEHYWVQDFGTRDDVYPLVINREAASTDSAHVSLYLYGSWDQVRLRNDAEPWSSWRPFANTLAWTLPASAGLHTVQAEMRAGGQTATSGDSIVLTALPTLGGLPDEMYFTYSRSEQRLLPGSASGTPINVGNGDRFTWQATVTGSHFWGEGLSGQDGDSFRIVPVGYEQSAAGTYRGTVAVTVTEPPSVQGSPQQIALTLRIVDASFETVHLPLIVQPATP